MEHALIDLDELVLGLEEDWEIIREIFDVFVEEAPGRREKFEKALAEDDFEAMILLAHSLKGASGTIKAEPLRQACYVLEQAARAGDAAKTAEFTPIVLDLLDKTAARMEELKPTLRPAS